MSSKSLDQLQKKRTRAHWKFAVVLALVLLPFTAWIAGSMLMSNDTGPSTDTSTFTSGEQIAVQLGEGLVEPRSGSSVADVQCPSQQLVAGDTVVCRATFQDGTFRDLAVTVGPVNPDGSADLGVDVAD